MPRGISLHIGLNLLDSEHYAGWDGALRYCEADAEAMREIAAQVGYESSVLRSTDATLDRVVGALRRAAGELGPGDIFFLSYAGHGGQLPDQRAGEFRDEEDRVDETWCLFDGQLSDDEQSVLYAGFRPGVRILVLSDSCHSGTVTRGPVQREIADLNDSQPVPGQDSARFRFMPRDMAVSAYSKNQEFYAGRRGALPDKRPQVLAAVQLLSGCQDHQLSGENFGHGFFTQALIDTWDNGRFEGDYSEFHRSILGLMPKGQQPNLYRTGAANVEFESERPFAV